MRSSILGHNPGRKPCHMYSLSFYSPQFQQVGRGRLSLSLWTQHSQMLYAKDVDGSGQASTQWWPRRDAQFSRSNMHQVGSPCILYTQPNHIQPHSAVAAQLRSRMATEYSSSNGSFHTVLACSAGSPGFDSRLIHIILRCSIQRMQMALVKPLRRRLQGIS